VTWQALRVSDPNPSRDPRLEVTFGVRVAAWWSACFIVITLAIYLLVVVLSRVSLVTITVSVAVMMAALLQPAVGWLTLRRVPRALAAIIVFILGVGGVTVLGWFVVTQVASSAPDMKGQLQEAAQAIRDSLIDGPLKLKAAEVDKYTTDLGDTLGENRGALTSGFLQTASSAVGVLSGAVFTLFALLFLLFDSGQIWRGFVGLVPPHAQPHAMEAGRVAWRTLTRYMRALVLLAAINALAMVPVMMIADLPMIVPLTILLFLGSLVPLVGILVAGAIVALIALVSQGLATAILVTVALVLVVQLFGNLLNPVLLGKAVDIHPLAILIGVTAGTLLGGVFGAFVAVPLVAVLKNASLAVRDHHRSDADDGHPEGDDSGALAAT
jgi:putative heme transporter